MSDLIGYVWNTPFGQNMADGRKCGKYPASCSTRQREEREYGVLSDNVSMSVLNAFLGYGGDHIRSIFNNARPYNELV